MSAPKLYVVVLNWNLKDDTAETVESLLRSSYQDFRIVIVDNGSADGSADHLGQRFPSVHVIPLESNRGFAGGNNAGIIYALGHDADYVLLLNNDTVVEEHCLELLLTAVESDPRLGIIAPVIYYFNRLDTVWQCGARDRRIIPLPVDLRAGDLCVNRNPETGVVDVDYVTGCAMLIRARALKEAGLLDERYFMYYEDSDLCVRVRAHGYRVGVASNAKIWHKVGSSTRSMLSLQRYLRVKSRMLFYMRHARGLKRLAILSFLAGSVLIGLGSDILKGQPLLVKAQVLGLIHGLSEWNR